MFQVVSSKFELLYAAYVRGQKSRSAADKTVIWKSRHGHLGIGNGTGIDIGIRIPI